MHHRAKDITGLRVGYLTALKYHGSNGKKSIWEVQCDCGVTVLMPATEMPKLEKRGVMASCGCKKRETIATKNSTHGMSQHPAYWAWRSMNDRCSLPTHQAWANYGGRGIQVCERWQTAFENFWADMGPTYKRGLTLERVDNSAGYGPKNCRWRDYFQQANNRRDNIRVGGSTLAEIARLHGINSSTIYYRYHHNLPLLGFMTS